jgi:arylsulfatase A-like enzyme
MSFWRRSFLHSIVLVAIGVAIPAGSMLSADRRGAEAIESLTSLNAGTRFDAALALVAGTDKDIDARLQRALQEDRFQESADARTAADFVLWMRKGNTPQPLPPEDSRGTNVLLISVDTLRADHLGCYGYERPTSPTIDRLARIGVLFEMALSPAPWTLPTHMSIFTSLYPSFHKVDTGRGSRTLRLDASEVTLAEALKRAGHTTAAFVAHPYLADKWGFDRGFDLFQGLALGHYTRTAARQTDRALLWLQWHHFHVRRGRSAAPFFLFIHYFDPHEPYDAPLIHRRRFTSDYNGPLRPKDLLAITTQFSRKEFASAADFEYVLALYDAEIHYVDSNIERLLQTLKATGWFDSTMIVLTSDHGEEFKDHGSMGHKEKLYEEQLRVPLIMTYPQGIRNPGKVKEPVSLLDIYPTVLDMLGLDQRAGLQGMSLQPYIDIEAASERRGPPATRDLFAELGPTIGLEWERDFHLRALRSGRYKLIHRYPGEGRVEQELYDLRRDPGEQRNIYETMKNRSIVRRLEERLADFIREGDAYNRGAREKNRITPSDETLEKLRSLGYVN